MSYQMKEDVMLEVLLRDVKEKLEHCIERRDYYKSCGDYRETEIEENLVSYFENRVKTYTQLLEGVTKSETTFNQA